MAVAPGSLPTFAMMCERERCPYAVVGVATDERELAVGAIDPEAPPAADAAGAKVIDMPMNVLLGKPPKMHRDVRGAPSSCRRSTSTASPWRRSRSTCCAIRPSPASAS